MKRLTLALVAVAVLTASCASDSTFRADSEVVKQRIKQCSDTPQNAISMFLQGIKEFSLALLRAAIPEKSSLYGVFGNNDERRGQEIVRQISAHPEVIEEGGSCSCSLLSMRDTGDQNEKIVEVKRAVVIGDDLHNYKRAFRVRFEPNGNCILQIDPIGPKWEPYAIK